MSVDSVSSSRKSYAFEERCVCGERIGIYTSKTQNNPDRTFFRCATFAKNTASLRHHFKWADEALVQTHYGSVECLEEHEREISELKNRLKMAEDLLVVLMKKTEEDEKKIKALKNQIVLAAGSVVFVCFGVGLFFWV